MEIEDFVLLLKESMEHHSDILKKGEIILPKYLKGKNFTKEVFPKVIETLKENLGLQVLQEFSNSFNPIDEIGNPQRVDFAFFNSDNSPFLFLELESINRAQLYLFLDAEFRDKDSDNKLWYYYGTLANHFAGRKKVPEYFIFLICLPNRQVAPYLLYDRHTCCQIFHKSLQSKVFENPYLFYDPLIKSQARGFLRSQCYYFPDLANEFIKVGWENCQKICELIFITWTGDQLILSRGRDQFNPALEIPFTINWNRCGL